MQLLPRQRVLIVGIGVCDGRYKEQLKCQKKKEIIVWVVSEVKAT